MTRADTISTLWIIVMINMAFADILSFMVPELLQQMMRGRVDGITITPGFLLVAALFIQVPVAMIFLSRWLAPRAARIANLIAVPVTVLFVVGGGSMLPHYLLLGGVEVAAMIWIATLAWGWRGDPVLS